MDDDIFGDGDGDDLLIEKYKNNWGYISSHSFLRESFMRDYKDNVIWNFISKFQK